MLEMKLLIHGRVQGVGYRYSILEHIEKNQIMVTGYVCNLPNGTVEIAAYGDIEALKDLRRVASQGSSRSEVRDIEEIITDVSESPFSSFEIKY